ncbi:MAG: transposon-encoded TnpW family protein [Eubacterium sp.]|nr:transposon-encoded TnpW family protein [Eubacterium sp.]
MDNGKTVRVTETVIGGTVYIVESVESESARSTVYDKVKKLIQNDIKSQQFQA